MIQDSPILYHGTDARIARLSKEEREAIKAGCIRFLDDMYTVLKPYMFPESFRVVEGTRVRCYDKLEVFKPFLDYDKDEDNYWDFSKALMLNKGRATGSTAWHYGCIYLTKSKGQAIGYADRAYMFGEIGMITFYIYSAILRMKSKTRIGRGEVLDEVRKFATDKDIRDAFRIVKTWSTDEGTQRAIDYVMEFSKGPKEPVIFEVRGLKYSELQTDRGETVTADYIEFMDVYRCPKDLYLNPADAFALTEEYIKAHRFD